MKNLILTAAIVLMSFGAASARPKALDSGECPARVAEQVTIIAALDFDYDYPGYEQHETDFNQLAHGACEAVSARVLFFGPRSARPHPSIGDFYVLQRGQGALQARCDATSAASTRECLGGSNDGTPCNVNSTCHGGGVCSAIACGVVNTYTVLNGPTPAGISWTGRKVVPCAIGTVEAFDLQLLGAPCPRYPDGTCPASDCVCMDPY